MRFEYKETAGANDAELESLTNSLSDYQKRLAEVASAKNYDFDESSINLPFDDELEKRVREAVQAKRTNSLKYIVVIGIGGSNLGTRAIYEAIRGATTEVFPRILFADTVSSTLFSNIVALLQATKSREEFCINVISKSGTTTETIALFEALMSRLGDVSDRIVATTDEGSRLWNTAKEKNIAALAIPAKVGGRYSVLSAVGLFPLALAGIDTEKLREGARSSVVGNKNAIVSAALIFRHMQNKISILNEFYFAPELESMGKWYRQLVGESLGKRHDMGITPIVSIGSTDLHSMAQLYFGGPRDKFTNLVRVESEGTTGNFLKHIMDAIYGGARAAYLKNQLPFTETTLPEISEYYLGMYLQFKMLEVMYLAKLMNVNAFDQPAVEDYKEETRKLLG